MHCRCIQFIESYLVDGIVDWAHHFVLPKYNLASKELSDAQIRFWDHMVSVGLKANTIDGYRRLVHYFLLYLEDKGVLLSRVKSGDIVTFIALVCQEHYQPTSLGAHLPGNRMFIRIHAERFRSELPEHPPKKEVY